MKHLRPLVLLLPLIAAGCSLTKPQEASVCPPPPPCPACEPTQCPEPQVIEKIVKVPVEPPPPPPAQTPQTAQTAGELHLPIIGATEWVAVEPGGLVMEARIDTGAETCSIHAEDIQLLEKEGKRFVSFKLIDPQSEELLPMELPLRRRVLIKMHEGGNQRRYVVKMWLTLGETRARVEVNLNDREEFEYPLLIGRNFLVDNAIVDVSRQHTLGSGPDL